MRKLLFAQLLLWCSLIAPAQEIDTPNNAFYNSRLIAALESKKESGRTEAILRLLSYYIGKNDTIDMEGIRKDFSPAIYDAVDDYVFREYRSVEDIEAFVGKQPEAERKNGKYRKTFEDLDKLCKTYDQLKSKKDQLSSSIEKQRIKLAGLSSQLQAAQDAHAAIPDTLASGESAAVPGNDSDTVAAAQAAHIKSITDKINDAKANLKNLKILMDAAGTSLESARNAVLNHFKEARKLVAIGSEGLEEAQAFSPATHDEAIYLTNMGNSAGASAAVMSPANETMSISNFRMPGQAEMIDALAIYIAKRFKQEVAITMISEMKILLQQRPVLGDLFPETLKLFESTASYEMPHLSRMWQHTMAEDFAHLPEHIASSPAIREYLRNNGSAQKCLTLFGDVVTLSKWVTQKNSLPDIVYLHRVYTNAIRTPLLKSGLDILYVVNSELHASTSSNGFWIGWNDLSNLNRKELTVFVTLLNRKYKDLFASFPNIQLLPGTASYAQNQDKLRNYLTKILVTLNTFQNAQKLYLKRLQDNPNSPYTGIDFWEFEQNLFDVLLNSDFIELPKDLEQWRSILKRGITMYQFLDQKNYAALVHEAANTLNDLVPKEKTRLRQILLKDWRVEASAFADQRAEFLNGVDELAQQIVADVEHCRQQLAASQNKDTVVAAFLRESRSTGSICKFRQIIARTDYKQRLCIQDEKAFVVFLERFVDTKGSWEAVITPATRRSQFEYVTKVAQFFTDVISAGNSKQLASVIESYSLPPNSYKIKRASRFSVDVNAYVGAYGGLEQIKKTDSSTGKKIGGVYGLSVPVGISLSWAFKSRARHASYSVFINRKGKIKDITGNSFTATLSMIDIAAPVAYRLAEGDNAALPKKLKWSQVLSPGLHLRWGIYNTPLCISTGIQYTPQLRNLKSSESTDQRAIRVYAGIFFDLPLYNAYRR